MPGKRVRGDAGVLLEDARGGRARCEAPYRKAGSLGHFTDRSEHVGLAGPRVALHPDNPVLGRQDEGRGVGLIGGESMLAGRFSARL